jgi:hypothetical protein
MLNTLLFNVCISLYDFSFIFPRDIFVNYVASLHGCTDFGCRPMQVQSSIYVIPSYLSENNILVILLTQFVMVNAHYCTPVLSEGTC